MAPDDAPTERSYPAFVYEVGSEKVREYARAIGEKAPVHNDRDAARAAGFRDLVAPPMFCVVYAIGALGPAIADPELGIDYAHMVHGGQEFAWEEPVCAGDTVTTTASVLDVHVKGGMGFFVFASVSTNQDGAQTVRGTWTNIVRRH